MSVGIESSSSLDMPVKGLGDPALGVAPLRGVPGGDGGILFVSVGRRPIR